MRIVTLVPGANDLVADLGLAGDVVGRAEGVPAGAAPLVARPVDVTAGHAPLVEGMEAHAHLTRFVYDRSALAAARPDVILTEEVCPVCRAACRPVADGVARGTATIGRRDVVVLSFNPRRLEDALAPIAPVATLLGHAERGQRLLHVRSARLLALSMHVARHLVRSGGERPGVLLARLAARFDPSAPSANESTVGGMRPLIVPGLWLPDMVDAAGGRPLLAVAGGDDVETTPAAAQAARPEVLILTTADPLDRQQHAATTLLAAPEWADVPATVAGPTWLLHLDRTFTSPAPHLVDGVEVLLRMISPLALGANGTPPPPERAIRLERAAPAPGSA